VASAPCTPDIAQGRAGVGALCATNFQENEEIQPNPADLHLQLIAELRTCGDKTSTRNKHQQPARHVCHRGTMGLRLELVLLLLLLLLLQILPRQLLLLMRILLWDGQCSPVSPADTKHSNTLKALPCHEAAVDFVSPCQPKQMPPLWSDREAPTPIFAGASRCWSEGATCQQCTASSYISDLILAQPDQTQTGPAPAAVLTSALAHLTISTKQVDKPSNSKATYPGWPQWLG
jgi:hypothetical protein